MSKVSRSTADSHEDRRGMFPNDRLKDRSVEVGTINGLMTDVAGKEIHLDRCRINNRHRSASVTLQNDRLPPSSDEDDTDSSDNP